MRQLKKTTPIGDGKNEHYHIALIDEDTGIGATSVALDHTHPLEYHPPTEPQYDQAGNEIDPGHPGGWVMGLGTDGSPPHEIIDYVIKTPEKSVVESEVVSEVVDLFKFWREVEKDSREKADEAWKFYKGEQWTQEQKQYLKSLDRACLTINLTQPKVDELIGHFIQDRQDLHYLPQEGGDQKVADILNEVTKHIWDQSYADREEVKVFKDAVIGGRGDWNLYVDFLSDLQGDIKIERFPRSGVVYGPHDKEDLSDCEGLIKYRYYSKAKIQQLWPDKADEIDKDYQYFFESTKDHVTYSDDQYNHSQVIKPRVAGDMNLVDVAKKEYLVLECWRKKYVTTSVVVSADQEFIFNAEGWDKADIKAIGTIPDLYVVEKPQAKMRITRVAGGVLLSDADPADLPVDDFFVVPVYCYKDGEDYYGKVEAAKDPQREMNKRHSQMVDIGNKMVSYVWLYDETTFPNPKEAEKFKDQSSSPGAVFKITDTNRPPRKEEGVKFPAELAQMMAIEAEQLDKVMNITATPGGANESGMAFLQKQKTKLIGNEFLFDNHSFSKRKVGRLLVSLIQKYYSPERIARILINRASKNPDMQLAGQPVSEFTDQDIIELLRTADLSKYDVVVSESAYSPSMRSATFIVMTELAKAGLGIPPTALIEFADLPEERRQKLLADMAQQQQADAAASQDTAVMEVGKTLAAKGIITPKIRELVGLPPEAQAQQGQGPQLPEDQSTLAA